MIVGQKATGIGLKAKALYQALAQRDVSFWAFLAADLGLSARKRVSIMRS
jgi:hypothetical protein